MKPNHHDPRGLGRLAALVLFAASVPPGCQPAPVAEQSPAAANPDPLAREMIGTWVQVGRPGQVSAPPAKGGRFKSRTGTHWSLTTADPATGLVTEHFGGTYTLHGDEYVETQTFADSTWLHDNGRSFKYTVKIEGDFMTQFGVDNPYTEVWQRVR